MNSQMAKMEVAARLMGTQKPNIRADFKIDVNWSPDEFKAEMANALSSEDIRIVCSDLEVKSNQASADVKKHSQSVEELTDALGKSKGLGEPVRVALENALRERKDKLETAKLLKEKLVQFGGLIAMRGNEIRIMREKRAEQTDEKIDESTSSRKLETSDVVSRTPKDYLTDKVKRGLSLVPRSELESMCRKHDIPTGGDTDERLRDKLLLYEATEQYEIDSKLTVREFEAFMGTVNSFDVGLVLRRSVEWPKSRAEVDKEKTNLQLLELREALKTTASVEVKRLLQSGIKEREAKLKHLDELIDKLRKFILVFDNKGIKL